MLGILALAAIFLAEDAVIGQPLGQEPPHRRLRRPIGDGHRIEGAAVELVLHVEPLAEVGQDRPAGDVGHLVEEADEIGGESGIGHGGLARTFDAASHAPMRPTTQASANRTADTGGIRNRAWS